MAGGKFPEGGLFIRHLIAVTKASRSEAEYCRHSKRTFGLALQAAAADVAAETVKSMDNALAIPFDCGVDTRVVLNPLGKSFPAFASSREITSAFPKADAGRLGARLGCAGCNLAGEATERETQTIRSEASERMEGIVKIRQRTKDEEETRNESWGFKRVYPKEHESLDGPE